MRDLTEEELKLAPDWATHYIADSDDSIIYESDALCWWAGLREPLNNKDSFGGLPNRSIKPFDITKHEFSDGISISNMCKSKVEIEFKDNDDFNYVPLSKSDVIAIAKALGVTAEDLK